MRTLLKILFFLLLANQSAGQTIYQKDFLFYWQTVNDNFAYFNTQKTNWDKVKTIYQPIADTINTRNDFIRLLENANNELYNGHVFLNTNTASSNRTVPTGADIKVVFNKNKFIIAEVRPGFNAALCGLKKGMVIIKYNDIPMSTAVKNFLPKAVSVAETPMYEYAATSLLAGTHNTKRKITVAAGNTEQSFFPDTILNKTETDFATVLDTKIIAKNIGYIKINNSLGNTDLIAAFDTALNNLLHTSALILDLRETPSGGTTSIAKAIMGRFINKEMAYQKHIYMNEEKETGIKRSALELVSPRPGVYKKPLIILAGYWTGSMGEGMVIGFAGMKRAKIAGTKMAGLLGEIYTFQTPEMKVPFSFPCVQLQNVYGQPREDFVPDYLITDQNNMVQVAAGLLGRVRK